MEAAPAGLAVEWWGKEGPKEGWGTVAEESEAAAAGALALEGAEMAVNQELEAGIAMAMVVAAVERKSRANLPW